MNTALYYLLDFLNEEFQPMMTVDFKNYTFGLFTYNSTYLGYNQGFLSLGLTLDFTNSTLFKDKNPTLKNLMLSEHILLLPRYEALSYAEREELREIDRMIRQDLKERKQLLLENNQ
jgi:hypothetical protein